MAGDSGNPPRAQILPLYVEGVAALGRIGPVVPDWEAPTPCGWSARDLTGHLLAIARYYHRLLDGVDAGHPLTGLPRGDELAEMNRRDLAILEEDRGQARASLFVDAATAHAARLEEANWGATLGLWAGLGPLLVAEHTAVAVAEWHVHAWDLARAAGLDHHPSDPAAVGRGQGAVGRSVGPGDPWTALLLAYGRDPAWEPPAG